METSHAWIAKGNTREKKVLVDTRLEAYGSLNPFTRAHTAKVD